MTYGSYHFGASWLGLALLAALLPLILAIIFFYGKKSTGVSRGWLLLVGLAAAIAIAANECGEYIFTGRISGDRLIAPGVAGVLTGVAVLIALPLIVRLWNKWTGDFATEAERQPTARGLRAWMNPRNLLMAVLVALLAWQGQGWSFWAVLGFEMAVILAYPLLNMLLNGGAGSRLPELALPASVSVPPPTDAPASLMAERERVLAMLESQHINADEAAELLTALGQSVPQKRSRLSPGRKLMMAGAALVLLAFPLPWMSIDLGAEMNRLTEIMPKVQGDMQQGMQFTQTVSPKFQAGGTMRMDGSDMQYGLGWTVLLLLVLAAAVPFAAAHVDRRTVLAVSIIASLLSSAIMSFLLLSSLRYMSVGAVVALLGCIAALTGAIKERKRAIADRP